MDKKLNEVTKVTDMAYVPVIMADGSIGQIAKSDLASVVAGAMYTNELFPFMYKGRKSIDSITESGIYTFDISNDKESLDAIGYGWGMLIHFQNPENWGTFQLATSNKTGSSDLFFRTHVAGTWSAWRRISS